MARLGMAWRRTWPDMYPGGCTAPQASTGTGYVYTWRARTIVTDFAPLEEGATGAHFKKFWEVLDQVPHLLQVLRRQVRDLLRAASVGRRARASRGAPAIPVGVKKRHAVL